MATPAPARFTFDLDLGRRQDRGRAISDSAVDRLIAEAREAGYAEGLAAGEQRLGTSAAGQLKAAGESLSRSAASMAKAFADAQRTHLAESVALSSSVARKLAASLVAARPARELEALIADCLSSLEGVPHLVIRCHPDSAETIRETTTAQIGNSGYTGRLVVIGDPELAIGDGRIEWADGGLVRDWEVISDEIDARIAAFLDAQGVVLEKTR